MDHNDNNSQAHQHQAVEQAETGPRRVLIVEDEALIAMYVEDVISKFGYSVAGVVSNVDEALAFIETHAVDAAVLDINLKGTLVFPFADALMRKGIPFVFASSYGERAIPARYRVGQVVQKPFAPSELRRALAATEHVRQRTDDAGAPCRTR
jgi:two-component SAPR family response regulator